MHNDEQLELGVAATRSGYGSWPFVWRDLLLWILSSKLSTFLREREYACVHAGELHLDILGNQAVDFK